MRLKLTPLALLLSLLASGVSAQLPPAPNTITIGLVPDPSGGARDLVLRVEATDVSDLYGLAFELQFPKKRLRWKEGSKLAGSFLSDDEVEMTVVLDRHRPRGTLNVGASRLGEAQGVTGSGVLVEIGFVNRKKSGPRTLTLGNPVAFDSDAMPIPDIAWEIAPFDDGSGG